MWNLEVGKSCGNNNDAIRKTGSAHKHYLAAAKHYSKKKIEMIISKVFEKPVYSRATKKQWQIKRLRGS